MEVFHAVESCREEDRTCRGGKGNSSKHAVRGIEVPPSFGALHPQFSSTVVRKPQEQTWIKLRVTPIDMWLRSIVEANSDSGPAVL